MEGKLEKASGKKINIYAPLSKGGVTTWSAELTEKLVKLGVDAKMINTIPGYFLQPFSSPITHSTLPFPHPISGKYVLTVHGIYTEEPLLWSKLYPMAIKSADIVTTSCKFLEEKLNLVNAKIIPNCINKPAWTKSNYEINGEVPTLGILTGFGFYNKARGLIELASIISRLPVRTKLLIGGNKGAYFEQIKEEVLKSGIDCEFLGFCDKQEFYNKIDIFTYYSLQDVFSLAILETMSYGIPCISNNVGGTGEMYNKETENLLASDNKQYEEILTALLSSQTLRGKYGKLQKEKVTEFYWENVLPQWLEIYNQ